MMAVVADEAIAPGVEGVAELPLPGDRLVFPGDRIEAEIHAAEIDRLGVLVAGTDGLAAAQSVRAVDPTIEAKNRMTHTELRILGCESFVQDVFLVRFAGALRVAQMGNVRSHRHNGAIFPQEET